MLQLYAVFDQFGLVPLEPLDTLLQLFGVATDLALGLRLRVRALNNEPLGQLLGDAHACVVDGLLQLVVLARLQLESHVEGRHDVRDLDVWALRNMQRLLKPLEVVQPNLKVVVTLRVLRDLLKLDSLVFAIVVPGRILRQ